MDKIIRTAAGVVLAGAAVLGLGVFSGCGSDGPTVPLTAEAFTRNRTAAARDAGNPVDRPGPLLYDTVHVPLLPAAQTPSEPVREISPAVQQTIRDPAANGAQITPNPSSPGPEKAGPDNGGPAAESPPAGQQTAGQNRQTGQQANASRPATGPVSSGGWVNLGAVLLEVNGRPIFTDKVLKPLEIPLAAEARKRNEASFRQWAKEQIDNSVRYFVNEELEFAAAQRSLEPQDEAVARALTMQWRQKQITDAGGVLEVARRRAAEQGANFDDLVEDQYRTFLSRIYYQKRMFPHVHVSAAAMRADYNARKDTDFTRHGSARFRVVKIDPRMYGGGREEALAKAQLVRKRATTEDFAQIAKETNDAPLLKSSGGYVVPDGWVAQGAYAVPEVDKAVFNMRPGEVSDIISANSGFYVVKVEEIKPGGVLPFEDLTVQDSIRKRLETEQLQALRVRNQAELRKNAITRMNDGTIQEALEIVMRRYPQWASAK